MVVEGTEGGSEAFTTPENPLHERVSRAGLGLASQKIDIGLRLLPLLVRQGFDAFQ
jgi:hypothetical protein